MIRRRVTSFGEKPFDIDEFTPVEYIEFDGNQYLTTAVYIRTDSKLVIDMQFIKNANERSTTANNAWISSSPDTSNFSINFGGSSGQYADWFVWAGNTATVSGGVGTSRLYARSTFTYNASTGKVIYQTQGVSGTATYSPGVQTKNLTDPIRLGINRLNTKIFNRHNLRIYSLKMYDGNNNLVNDMIPGVFNNNAGLYDQITQTWHTSGTNFNFIIP